MMIFSKPRTAAMMPNFLYIGAEKAGSTWIYEVLKEHPEVYVPPAKDTKFFYQHLDKGIDWYMGFFKNGFGKKAIGEVDHDLFLEPEYANFIHRVLPDVRLICCLREPVERTISSYLYWKLISVKDDVSFDSFAFRTDVLKLSDYYHNLKPFYEKFPREKILVLFFDELQSSPLQFVQKIYRFLEVDDTFCPRVIDSRKMPASEPRYQWIAHLAYTVGLWFRGIGRPNVVGRVKSNPLFNKLLYKEIKHRPEINEACRGQLKSYFQDRLQGLSELIGSPLPESWKDYPQNSSPR